MRDPANPGDWQDRIDTFNWPEALQRAVLDKTGGHTDWRVANIKELHSLIDERLHNPAIDVTVFHPIQPQSVFWSSSPVLDFNGNTDFSWVVGFDVGGEVASNVTRNGKYYAWLVRDAGSTPTPSGYVTDPAIVRAAYARLGIIADPAGVEWWARNPLGMREFWRGTKAEFVRICDEELAKL
jgi:hypothetical protein